MIKRYKLELAGLLCGAIAGYAYHHFVGCANGHCVIASSPYISTMYGAVMGMLTFSVFKKQPNKKINIQ